MKLSKKPAKKRINRRSRNRLRKLTFFLVPLSIIISIICFIAILGFIKFEEKKDVISPVTLPFNGASSEEDIFRNKIEDILREKNIQHKDVVYIEGSDFKIIMSNSSEVVISSEKDLENDLSSLQYILSRLKMEGKQFTRLDLRYDKPVVVLE